MTEARNIEIYGNGVNDFEVSPFESLDILHRRSRIERVLHHLSNDERITLLNYDLELIKNAKKLTEHIGQIYDFSLSDEPLNEWWWHLDQVANGNVTFSLSAEIKSDMKI